MGVLTRLLLRVTTMADFTIISQNVRGLGDNTKRRQKADIILLQETHFVPNCEFLWRNEWGGKAMFNGDASNARGVGILFKRGADFEIKKVSKDENGRVLIVDISIEKIVYTVCNIYAPNGDHPSFFVNVFKEASGN